MNSTLSPELAFTLSEAQKAQFERDGFLAVTGVFSPDEVATLRQHFMDIQNEALDPNSPLRAHYKPLSLEEANGDKLKHFPRIMHPARFDEMAMRYMIDSRIQAILSQLFGEEPLAAQSMLYFKPPGAKGQALHQDNFYLNVSPGTCLAAWLSLDAADEENGGMFMVPGSHKLPVLCPHLADMTKSFTTEEVDIPEGMEAVQVPLGAGDVLFFNGSVIHGSFPNVSKDRFRRAFICHYVGDSTRAMSGGYYPLWRFSGETLTREVAQGGSHSCGNEEWSDFQKSVTEFQREHTAQSGG
ncbi:MAG TPA: phytanoyl-CoA dioxygenase family protein, partial [Abditibacterium sp.]